MGRRACQRPALREIAFLREIDHPNVVRLIDVIHSNSELVLVFESMRQDLKQLIDSYPLSSQFLSPPHLPIRQIKSYLYQLFQGNRLVPSQSHSAQGFEAAESSAG